MKIVQINWIKYTFRNSYQQFMLITTFKSIFIIASEIETHKKKQKNTVQIIIRYDFTPVFGSSRFFWAYKT